VPGAGRPALADGTASEPVRVVGLGDVGAVPERVQPSRGADDRSHRLSHGVFRLNPRQRAGDPVAAARAAAAGAACAACATCAACAAGAAGATGAAADVMHTAEGTDVTPVGGARVVVIAAELGRGARADANAGGARRADRQVAVVGLDDVFRAWSQRRQVL